MIDPLNSHQGRHPYAALMERMDGARPLQFAPGPTLPTAATDEKPLDLTLPAVSGDKPDNTKPIETAEQFEALLVQQLVSGMRDTANVLGEGGMFGKGAGAETYTDWFDKELAGHVAGSADLGVVDAVMGDLIRWGQITPDSALATKSASANGPPATGADAAAADPGNPLSSNPVATSPDSRKKA